MPQRDTVAVREFFDRTGNDFASRYGSSPAFAERIDVWRAAIDEAAESLGGGGLCLDLGCGDGVLSRLAAGSGLSVVAIDQSETMLAAARRAVDGSDSDTEFIHAALPLCPDLEARFAGQARLILCSSVVEYIPDAARQIRQFAHLLDRRGILLLSVPNRRSWYRGVERVAKRILARTDWLPDYYIRHQHHQFDEISLARLLADAGLRPNPSSTRYFALPLQTHLARLLGGHRGKRTASLLLMGAEKV